VAYFVYVLECYRGGKFCNFYTGYTNDLKRRITQHRTNARKGNRRTYTGRFDKVEVAYYEEAPTLKEAKAREKQIKLMSTKEKEVLKASAANRQAHPTA
jgi:putative endonuclease